MLDCTTLRKQWASLEKPPLVFLLSLCVLFWWLGTSSLTWRRMGIPLLFAGWCFWQSGFARSLKKLPLVAVLPVLVALYTMLSPGQWFMDFWDGAQMLLMYLVGVSAMVFAKKTYWLAMLALPVALSLTYLGDALGLFSRVMTTEDHRLLLFHSHPNILGGVAAWGLVILAAYRDKWRGPLLYAALGTGILSVLVLALSASRAAYLGALIGVGFLLLPALKKRLLAVSVAVVLGVLGTTLALPQNQLERFYSAVFSPLSDRTLETRKPIWEAALSGIEHAPILGNSIGGFKKFHGEYVRAHSASLGQRYAEVEMEVFHPHNMFLGVLFMYGIAGTALFLGTIAAGMKFAWVRGDRFFPATLLFYIILGLFEFPLDRPDGIVMLFFPLGLAYGSVVLESLNASLSFRHPEK